MIPAIRKLPNAANTTETTTIGVFPALISANPPCIQKADRKHAAHIETKHPAFTASYSPTMYYPNSYTAQQVWQQLPPLYFSR